MRYRCRKEILDIIIWFDFEQFDMQAWDAWYAVFPFSFVNLYQDSLNLRSILDLHE